MVAVQVCFDEYFALLPTFRPASGPIWHSGACGGAAGARGTVPVRRRAGRVPGPQGHQGSAAHRGAGAHARPGAGPVAPHRVCAQVRGPRGSPCRWGTYAFTLARMPRLPSFCRYRYASLHAARNNPGRHLPTCRKQRLAGVRQRVCACVTGRPHAAAEGARAPRGTWCAPQRSKHCSRLLLQLWMRGRAREQQLRTSPTLPAEAPQAVAIAVHAFPGDWCAALEGAGPLPTGDAVRFPYCVLEIKLAGEKRPQWIKVSIALAGASKASLQQSSWPPAASHMSRIRLMCVFGHPPSCVCLVTPLHCSTGAGDQRPAGQGGGILQVPAWCVRAARATCGVLGKPKLAAAA